MFQLNDEDVIVFQLSDEEASSEEEKEEEEDSDEKSSKVYKPPRVAPVYYGNRNIQYCPKVWRLIFKSPIFCNITLSRSCKGLKSS